MIKGLPLLITSLVTSSQFKKQWERIAQKLFDSIKVE